MAFPAGVYAIEQPVEHNGSDYYRQVDACVLEVIRQVGGEMQHKPAHMVYELITLHVSRRLPGIEVDQEALRDAAARIAIGLPPA